MEESESRSVKERTVLYNSFMNAPAGIAILKGATHIFEFANSTYEKLAGKKITIGKTVHELFPEVEQQGIIAILNNVFATGEPFIANELAVELNTKGDGTLQKLYLNFVIQPLKDEKGNTERLLVHVIDVTEQVDARNKIEASEKRFSNILSQSLMAIAIFKGPEMVVTFANEPMIAVLGKGNYIINKPLLEGVPELKDQVFPQLLADVYSTGVAFEGFETKAILVRNGIPVEAYFNFVYQPSRDVDDTITGITVLATEVTDQVLAKKQIEESEKRFGMLADSIPNLAWMAYADGNIFWYNKKWFEYTGTTLAEMLGWGWQSVHDPEELPKVLIKWRASIETGKPFEMVFPIKGADGKFRQFLTRVLPVHDSENEIYRWFGTNTDIHEEKKLTEEKFLLEFAENFSHYTTGTEFFGSLVTYIANKTNIDYVFIGELTENEKNIFTINTIALANRGTFVPNIEYPLPDGPCEQVIRSTVYNYPKQCKITFPKNETLVQFNVEGYVGYPLFSNDGKAIGLVAVMHEKEIANPEYVSALLKIVAKRAEFELERNIITSKLQAKNLELENTNAELASFSYVASHDLKEPLRKIQAFSKRIIETENFSDKTQDYFNRIISAGERMQNLIDSLLDFSRANTTEWIFKPCDLNAIVEESKHDLHERILEKQAIIKSENLPTINGVYIQISQLITNLLDNAIKYSRPEIKPHIKITASIIEGKKIDHPSANNQKEYHTIKIADNGIGFEKEYANKIFELFQRLHHMNEYSGTGIGLAIVKKIVTNHNGFIIAEGKPNIGSTFTIYIPTL